MAVHGLVWQWWTLIYVRVHSHRSTVDNHVVFFDDFRCNLVILQSARTLVSAHEDGFQSERLQSIADGLGCTTRTENKGFLVERLDKRFYALGEAAPHLDGQYAAFGKIIEGMDVVDAIATTKTGAMDRPVNEQKMKKVTVETFGVEYDEPETY